MDAITYRAGASRISGMKKVFMAAMATMILAGCGGDQGEDFIGTWSSTSDSEVVVITAAPGGFRVETSGTIWDYEAMLKVESDTLLVFQENSKKALMMKPDGTIESYLRAKTKDLVKQ